MKHKCSNCSKVGTSRCSKCKIAFYCSRECQVACHDDHKNHVCKGVAKSLTWIANEERKLRREMPGCFGDADPEDSLVGSFWGYHETRRYMRARHNYFLYLDKIGTTPAIEEALVIGRDLLRLCRGDNLGIRSLMPALFLSLISYDRMQECYDFVKWWMTCDPDGRYDWGNVTLPYLNISGADMCEPVLNEALGRFSDVYECVAMTVIKIRLHHAVQCSLREIDNLLGASVVAAEHSPVRDLRGNDVVLANIAEFLRPSYPCFAQRSYGELRQLEVALAEQVETLLTAVEGRNPRIWKALVSPEKVRLAGVPPATSQGSAEEAACLVLSFMRVVTQDCDDARMIRQRLVDRVGENPEYDLTPRH